MTWLSFINTNGVQLNTDTRKLCKENCGSHSVAVKLVGNIVPDVGVLDVVFKIVIEP